MSRRRRTLLIIAVALAFVATACGTGGGGEAAPVDAASAALVDEFELLDGTTLDLASLQGEDVVLWFWAPW